MSELTQKEFDAYCALIAISRYYIVRMYELHQKFVDSSDPENAYSQEETAELVALQIAFHVRTELVPLDSQEALLDRVDERLAELSREATEVVAREFLTPMLEKQASEKMVTGEVEGQYKLVKAKDIELSAPRHAKLRPDQTEKLQFVWNTMGNLCWARSYEELDHNMRCDVHPDREITLMVAVARTYKGFLKKHKGIDKQKLSADLLQLTLEKPIFRKHAEELEKLVGHHMLSEQRKFYAEHGDDTLRLIGDDWSNL